MNESVGFIALTSLTLLLLKPEAQSYGVVSMACCSSVVNDVEI